MTEHHSDHNNAAKLIRMEHPSRHDITNKTRHRKLYKLNMFHLSRTSGFQA